MAWEKDELSPVLLQGAAGRFWMARAVQFCGDTVLCVFQSRERRFKGAAGGRCGVGVEWADGAPLLLQHAVAIQVLFARLLEL